MALDTAIEQAMEDAGLTQRALAQELNVSRSAINAWKNGYRRIPREVAGKLVEALDCGFVAMELAYEFTGGAWMKTLDGEHVDLHRASVRLKAEEELYEALEAIRKVCVAHPPETVTADKLRELHDSLLQVLDAIVALTHYAAVVCREYKLSWVELWRAHHRKLKARKYVR